MIAEFMSWTNVALFGCLFAGHAALWIALVNRLHSQPWLPQTLKLIRHFHDAVLVLFPLAAIWFVGLHGPRLLYGGGWNELNEFWTVVFAVCAAGCVWLCFRSLFRLYDRFHELSVKHATHVYNIAAELGHLPAQPGPYSSLIRIPRNQQFQLECNEKHFFFPHLPAGWEGMSILHLSDFHYLGTITQEYYSQVLEKATRQPADLLCFTGDLIDNMKLLSWIPATLGQYHGTLGSYFILGNHDWYQDPLQVRQTLSDCGWTDLGSRNESLCFHGARLLIGGDETPWMGDHPDMSPPADFRLLLSHTPDNIRWACRQNVQLMLSGHNHGGQVQLPLIGPIYSPSRYGCRFASGTFQLHPTLLHVSRGLAGQHPLRWNCRPEITRIVLHRKP